MNLFNPAKTVNLTLVGLDGNAFSLMGAFSKQAKKEGWTKEEIDIVLKECMSGNYDDLLCTLMDHCEEVYEEDEYNGNDFSEFEDYWDGAQWNRRLKY